MQFRFGAGGGSGYLAFTPPPGAPSGGSSAHPLLLVADAGHDAVHLIDVVKRSHAGYLASPGSLSGPQGVAASAAAPDLVAVTSWKTMGAGEHVVMLYRGGGVVWEAVRVIGGGFGSHGDAVGQLSFPSGLRFSGDGTMICVADWDNNRVSLFRVGDGGFERHVGTGLHWPHDVEEVNGGWLVANAGSDRVEFVGDECDGPVNGRPFLGSYGGRDGEFMCPTALVVVPGLGLVVRERGNQRFQVRPYPFCCPPMWPQATLLLSALTHKHKALHTLPDAVGAVSCTLYLYTHLVA